MRHIVIAAIATALVASALPAAAKSSGGGKASHKDITVTKTTDKGSTKMMSQTKPKKTSPKDVTVTKKTDSASGK